MLSKTKIYILTVLATLTLFASIYGAIIWLGNNITILPTHEFNEILKVSAHEVDEQELARRSLEIKLRDYLAEKNSPLAQVAETLSNQPSYKLIIALSYAESSLCKNYPKETVNCWGMGGSDLWDFGETLSDGVRGANSFLENYPRGYEKKYKDWTVAELNGFYKQPATAQWAVNVNLILNELESL